MLEKHFPILKKKINGRRLVYLDNAATTQKPKAVIRAVSDFYERHNANIHRGLHTLSEEATKMYEKSRKKVQNFINASSPQEIIFTKNATEAINLVANTWGKQNIKRGDEIVLSEMEHHANLLPWQILAKEKGVKLKFIRLKNNGTLDLKKIKGLLSQKTKLVALTHISNVLGTVNPVAKIIKIAHKKNIAVLIDGAQAGAHELINVQKLDADFYVLAGHKMYAPLGIGVLFGKKGLLQDMPVYQAGGGMIKTVTPNSMLPAKLPQKFEAGTPNIVAAIGLGAAINFIESVGINKIRKYELELTNYAIKKISKIKGLKIFGPQKNIAPVIAFDLEGVPAHDVATVLDADGVAIRVGHHCAILLHKKLGLPASCRISFGIYNTRQDIDQLVKSLKNVKKIFGI